MRRRFDPTRAGGADVNATDRLWTTNELAGYLQVSVHTIYHWRYQGDAPPAIKVGRSLRFRPADVDAWLSARADY